MTALYRADWST